MDSKTLEQARKKLDVELQEITEELVDLGAKSDGTLEVSLDEGFADAAHATSERSTVLSLVQKLQRRAEEVNAAIKRIEGGTYGTCTRCGNQIDSERLEALPSVKLCISCAQEAKN